MYPPLKNVNYKKLKQIITTKGSTFRDNKDVA